MGQHYGSTHDLRVVPRTELCVLPRADMGHDPADRAMRVTTRWLPTPIPVCTDTIALSLNQMCVVAHRGEARCAASWTAKLVTG